MSNHFLAQPDRCLLYKLKSQIVWLDWFAMWTLKRNVHGDQRKSHNTVKSVLHPEVSKPDDTAIKSCLNPAVYSLTSPVIIEPRPLPGTVPGTGHQAVSRTGTSLALLELSIYLTRKISESDKCWARNCNEGLEQRNDGRRAAQATTFNLRSEWPEGAGDATSCRTSTEGAERNADVKVGRSLARGLWRPGQGGGRAWGRRERTCGAAHVGSTQLGKGFAFSSRCERKPLAGFKRKGAIGFTFCQVVNI